MNALSPADRARNIARRVLVDGYDPLLAARELAVVTHQLAVVPKDVRRVFEGVASETDDLPVGRERVNWSLEALREKDPEADAYREQVRAVVNEACQALLNALDAP
jgi:hypothetical protein